MEDPGAWKLPELNNHDMRCGPGESGLQGLSCLLNLFSVEVSARSRPASWTALLILSDPGVTSPVTKSRNPVWWASSVSVSLFLPSPWGDVEDSKPTELTGPLIMWSHPCPQGALTVQESPFRLDCPATSSCLSHWGRTPFELVEEGLARRTVPRTGRRTQTGSQRPQ